MVANIIIDESASGGTPGSGTGEITFNPTTKKLRTIDDAGTTVDYGADNNPMTTSGDTIYGGASGVQTRLAKGSDTQVLTLTSGLPAWETASGGLDKWVSGTTYVTDDVIWLSADDKIYSNVTGNSDVTFTVSKWNELSTDIALTSNSYSETLTSGNWVLDTGTIYYQDVTHGLGTIDIVKSFRNTSDDSDIIVESVIATDTNNIRVKIEGNSLNIRLTFTSGVSGVITANTAVFTALSGNTTLNVTTHKYITVDTSGGDVTLTLPLSANGLYSYDIWKITSDTNSVFVVRAGSDTIHNETSVDWSTPFKHVEFVPDTSSTWYMK